MNTVLCILSYDVLSVATPCNKAQIVALFGLSLLQNLLIKWHKKVKRAKICAF